MNNEAVKAPASPRPVMLAVILAVIAVITALALGVVNYITEDAINEAKTAKTAAAMAAVLPADSYEPVQSGRTEKISAVMGAYAAYRDGARVGWVVETASSGFGGTISMVVGVDADGAVTGVSIVSMSETSGLGANAKKESFRSQYIGKSGTVALTKNGGEIDALTGATVTSNAVTKGVNAALWAAAELEAEADGLPPLDYAQADAATGATN